MTYKKYIKRGGKLYGPYVYESKRVDGKVVSQYHGSGKTLNIKKFAWIFVSSVFVLFLAYFLSTFDFGGLTGYAVLGTDANYTANQPILGNVALSLSQGELLPANSKLILENSGQSYEYDLKNVVSNQPTQGDFYVDGVSLSGNGEGYGMEGERQVYPDVAFTLNIYSLSDNLTGSDNSAGTSNASSETILTGTISNETISNETIFNETINNSTTPEIVDNAKEAVNETVIDNSPSSPDETVESAETAGTAETSLPSETPETTNSLTGFFTRIYNLFLGLTLTGKAVSENGEINGQASLDNPFEYVLADGESIGLKSGSVSVSGIVISDDSIQINTEGNRAIVKTSYSKIEKGFGRGFSGSGAEILNINLSSLGLVLNDGELIARIVYENREIISNSIVLASGVMASNLTNTTNSTTLNVTIEQNQTIENSSQISPGLQIITAETVSLILTEEEKALLAGKYGADTQLQTTQPEAINERMVGRYEFGNQWVGYSYDSHLAQQDLDYQMSIDKMKWLKDLAQRISNEKSEEQKNTVYLDNSSIGG
ncbi:MAG: hypothetical protein AABY15_09105 [Nanoarchaeota archaeon]